MDCQITITVSCKTIFYLLSHTKWLESPSALPCSFNWIFQQTTHFPFKLFLHYQLDEFQFVTWSSLQSLLLSLTFLFTSSRDSWLCSFPWSCDIVSFFFFFLERECLYYGLFSISLAVYNMSLYQTQSQKERTIVYWFLNPWSLAQNLTQIGI